MDAWIEISIGVHGKMKLTVASFVDAWIEILAGISTRLKATVASFVDAWIEIQGVLDFSMIMGGRILRGCVD